jgi:hypothetical protein
MIYNEMFLGFTHHEKVKAFDRELNEDKSPINMKQLAVPDLFVLAKSVELHLYTHSTKYPT